MKLKPLPVVMFATVASTNVAAQQEAHESRWNIQIGPAYGIFHESAALSIEGRPVTGAGLQVQNKASLAAELSYRLMPNWSAGLTVGIPARTRVTGRGTAKAFGEMGAASYGSLAVTAKYALSNFGHWRPYVGAGISYLITIKEYDAAINNLEINNAFGKIIQAGITYKLDSSRGVFLDLKKLFVKTTANGNTPLFAGAPVRADIRLNPVIIHAGFSYNF